MYLTYSLDVPYSVSDTVLSLILMVVIRYISLVLVWILTALVVLGSIGDLQTPQTFSHAANVQHQPNSLLFLMLESDTYIMLAQ